MSSPLFVSLHFWGMNEEPVGSLIWFEAPGLVMRLLRLIFSSSPPPRLFSFSFKDSTYNIWKFPG